MTIENWLTDSLTKGLFEKIGVVAKIVLPDPDPQLRKLKEIIKKLNKDKSGIRDRRIQVNHSVWWNPIPPAEGLPMTHRLRDQFPFSLEPVRLEELKELVLEIERTSLELMAFRSRFLSEQRKRTS